MHHTSAFNKFQITGPLLVMSIALAFPMVTQAQDIVAELKYRCEQVGGIMDEDHQCIDPIIVQGEDDVIPLSDVELPALQRTGSPRLRVGNQLFVDEPIDAPTLQPVVPSIDDGTTINVTQEQGLRMCFNQLEYEVRACYYAFPKDIQAHNECVQEASATYDGCLRWVQTLPYEEFQN